MPSWSCDDLLVTVFAVQLSRPYLCLSSSRTKSIFSEPFLARGRSLSTQIRTELVRRALGCIKITPRKSWFSVEGKTKTYLVHKNLSICVRHALSPDRVKKYSVCQVFLNLWLTR